MNDAEKKITNLNSVNEVTKIIYRCREKKYGPEIRRDWT